MRAPAPLLLLALVACDGSDANDGTGPFADAGDDLPDIDAPEGDDPYVEEDTADEPISFDAEAVGAVVAAVLPAARATDGAVIQAAYAEVSAGESEGCPSWTTSAEGTPYWFDSCTSDDGTQFEGYAYELFSTDFVDNGVTWDGWQFYGIATVVGPTGDVFEAAGGAGSLVGVQEDGTDVFYSYMSEGFTYDGPAADGTWLQGTASPELAVYALSNAASGARVLSMVGRVLLDDGPVRAVVFEDLQASNAASGDPCPEEPTGTVSVLDAQGSWIDLAFDGVPYDQWANGRPDACDGCATAWNKGTELGEVCIDTSRIADWTTSPWEEDGDTN